MLVEMLKVVCGVSPRDGQCAVAMETYVICRMSHMDIIVVCRWCTSSDGIAGKIPGARWRSCYWTDSAASSHCYCNAL